MKEGQARRMAEEVELQKPAGYLCEWKATIGLPNDQVFYHVEPGSATADDWNRTPDVYKNAPYYTEYQVREAIAVALVKLTQGQEPFGWYDANFDFDHFVEGSEKPTGDGDWKPLYTHPAPRQQEERKPLNRPDVLEYVTRYGGRCRDCADENGVCPNSGLPCAGYRKAITHVLSALDYGLKHGYIKEQK